MMSVDICIDERAGVAYVTTHPENTIDRVAFQPGQTGDVRLSVAGQPFTEQLINPTAGDWGRGRGEYGRVAYFLTTGGINAPAADGIVRPAKVLRAEFDATCRSSAPGPSI